MNDGCEVTLSLGMFARRRKVRDAKLAFMDSKRCPGASSVRR